MNGIRNVKGNRYRRTMDRLVVHTYVPHMFMYISNPWLFSWSISNVDYS